MLLFSSRLLFLPGTLTGWSSLEEEDSEETDFLIALVTFSDPIFRMVTLGERQRKRM